MLMVLPMYPTAIAMRGMPRHLMDSHCRRALARALSRADRLSLSRMKMSLN